MASKLPWLLGGGAAAYYLWSRSRRTDAATSALVDEPTAAPPSTAQPTTTPTTQGAIAIPLSGRWVWPVPLWNSRKPDISSGWGSPRGKGKHAGVDIMYHRAPSDPYKIGSPNGTKGYVMPENVPALAASDGLVWSAAWTPRGFAVVIDHGAPSKVATYYNHLSTLFVTPTERGKSGQRVAAGQALGIIGNNPLDSEKIKHLHFAIWRGGPKAAVDPKPIMASWEMVTPTRNAGLTYRTVGGSGERYPDWVRALDGKSGSYVIRESRRDGDAEVVYVGSSNGRLYDTLTRHFQQWRRHKGFWRGHYAEGHDPGLTYDRRRVDVAVRLTAPDEALDEEARLIARLRPRDNILMQPTDDVPF